MSTTAAPFRLTPENRRVFLGLILGMLVAAVSQTIVGPAMPRIVAELGGMAHYSWVATAAMLTSAVIVPIVGKLSDLYGRRVFFLGGLVVFMTGALISGLATNFWVLVAGRAIQGMGMGTVMPLAQTIVGDITPERHRGKYQGYMGAVFGVTSVGGPIAGGLITDALNWRWLFLLPIPFGIVALLVVARFLKLQHTRQEAHLDVWGILTVAPALVLLLLATSWGGGTYPWVSLPVLGSYAVGVVLLVVFVFIERRVAEPLLPLGMFRNRAFTMSVLGALMVAMVMFGTIIYVPVYAQGVLGMSAMESGLALVPLMLGNIVFGISAGFYISRTGRYKELMVLGLILMGVAIGVLATLSADSSFWHLMIGLVLMGTGLGLSVQQFMLVVQNASPRRQLGVATSMTQFFRNIGSTVGVTILGTIMTGGLASAVASHLPADVAAEIGGELEGLDASAVLNPDLGSQFDPVVLEALRVGLTDQLTTAFLATLPMLAIALAATLAIPNLTLRESVSNADEARQEYLTSMGQSLAKEIVPGLGHDELGARTRERLLALHLRELAEQTYRDDRELLNQAITAIGDGDLEAGRALLQRTAEMLTSEDYEQISAAEPYASSLAKKAASSGGILSEELRKELAVRAARKRRQDVLGVVEPPVTEPYDAVNIAELRHAANDLSIVLLMDLESRRSEQE